MLCDVVGFFLFFIENWYRIKTDNITVAVKEIDLQLFNWLRCIGAQVALGALPKNRHKECMKS